MRLLGSLRERDGSDLNRGYLAVKESASNSAFVGDILTMVPPPPPLTDGEME
jgi:hypothetical protein